MKTNEDVISELKNLSAAINSVVRANKDNTALIRMIVENEGYSVDDDDIDNLTAFFTDAITDYLNNKGE